MAKKLRFRQSVQASGFQKLHERIKWLRQNQKPYMTQAQLAAATGIRQYQIGQIEMGNPTFTNMKLNRLRTLAHGLGVDVYINFRSRNGGPSTAFLLERLPLPEPPPRPSKLTPGARWQAARKQPAPWTKAGQQKVKRRRKGSSGRKSLVFGTDKETVL